MQTTFMKLAIEEAKKGAKKGARQTFTNPLVGAVITQKVLLQSLKIKCKVYNPSCS